MNQVVPSVTKDGEFITGATPDEIAKAQAGRDGYAIDLTKLDEAVRDLAKRLLQQFPECVRYTKQQTNFWKDLAWSSTIGHARDWLALHYASLEPWEGMRAFVEKRSARYMDLRTRAAEGGSSEFPWGAYDRKCEVCGATGLPASFGYCGKCGAELPAPSANGAGERLVEAASR